MSALRSIETPNLADLMQRLDMLEQAPVGSARTAYAMPLTRRSPHTRMVGGDLMAAP